MSLLAAHRVAQASRDADEAIAASKNAVTAHSYAVKREAEEREARRRAAVERMHTHYMAKWATKKAAQAKAAARTATRGPGWKVLPLPPQELERFAKTLWHDGFLGIPWPAGWSVKWADLRGPGIVGMCVFAPKLILIDAAAHQALPVPSEQLIRTLAHELAHSQHPHGKHGEGFLETERRLLASLLGPDAQTAPSAARPPHPAPPTGRPVAGRPPPSPPVGLRRGPRGFFAQPGLDPTLEYRG